MVNNSAYFFFQAEVGIRDLYVTEFRRVLFRSTCARPRAPAWCTCSSARTVSLLLQVRRRLLSNCFHVAQIGRASCRERVEKSVVVVPLQQYILRESLRLAESAIVQDRWRRGRA